MTPTLKISALDRRIPIPTYKTDGAAGLDIAAWVDQPIMIETGAISVVPTGLRLAIPFGYEGQVRPRSGLSTRQGITVVNAPGTIDSDYRGELLVPLLNVGHEPFTVESGMRIAQLVISPVARVHILKVDDLDQTKRGTGGFGSTGFHA